MTIATKSQAHARTVRARLWRPSNAVPDPGFTEGKAVKAALAELMQRNAIEYLQLAEQARLDRVICRASSKAGWRYYAR